MRRALKAVKYAAIPLALAAFLLATVSSTTTHPATAANATAGSGQGIGSLAPAPDIQNGNQPTRAEAWVNYPVDTFPTDFGGELASVVRGQDDPLHATTNTLASVWAGFAMDYVVIVATLTIRMVEWAFSFDLIGSASGPLGQSTQALANQVYGPALTVGLTLVGGWLIWTLMLKRQVAKGFSGMAWALGITTLTGIYFLSPGTVLATVNDLDASAGRVILSAMASGDPAMVNRTGNPTLAKGDASSAELRLFADRFWTTFVYQPFMVATFGDQASGARWGEAYVRGLADPNGGDPAGFKPDFDAHASEATRAWFHGAQGGARMVIVMSDLGLAIVTGAAYVLPAGVLIISQFGLLLMALVFPLAALAALHPGWGRRIFIRWLDLLVLVLFLRIAGGVMMGGILVIGGLTASMPNWLLQVSCQIGIVVTLWIARKRIWSLIGSMAEPVVQPVADSRVVRYTQAAVAYVDKQYARFDRTTSAKEIADEAARRPAA